jgi:putative Mn2+ efflux pump MntP
MSISSIILIAIALAMDAFAVAVSTGFTIHRLKIRHSLIIATWFGLFQAIMPLIGWLGGIQLQELIKGIDHWIIFGLLTFIGAKMIYESFKIDSVEKTSDPLAINVLFLLSIATSLDALAAGFTFALLDVDIVLPVLIIGIVTFVMSYAGAWIGNKVGHFFEKKIEIAGGLILIAIGLKILVSHLMAG